MVVEATVAVVTTAVIALEVILAAVIAAAVVATAAAITMGIPDRVMTALALTPGQAITMAFMQLGALAAITQVMLATMPRRASHDR